jgi:hypothetical protein
MRKLLLFSLAVILTVLSISAFCRDDQQQKKVIYTTLDVKQDYEIISIIAAPVDISPGFGNPITKAYKSAWELFEANSKSSGADAVVGVRIELQNINSTVVGRLLIYGTAVKFKNTEEKK